MDIIGVTVINNRPGVPSKELRYVLRLNYTILISETYEEDTDGICYDIPTAFEEYLANKKNKPYLLTDWYETE